MPEQITYYDRNGRELPEEAPAPDFTSAIQASHHLLETEKSLYALNAAMDGKDGKPLILMQPFGEVDAGYFVRVTELGEIAPGEVRMRVEFGDYSNAREIIAFGADGYADGFVTLGFFSVDSTQDDHRWRVFECLHTVAEVFGFILDHLYIPDSAPGAGQTVYFGEGR